MSTQHDQDIADLEQQLAAQEAEEANLRERFIRAQSAKVSVELGEAKAARKQTEIRLRQLKANR